MATSGPFSVAILVLLAIFAQATCTVIDAAYQAYPVDQEYPEYQVYPGVVTPDQTFARCDANNDSKLSFFEFLHENEAFIQSQQKQFAQFDTNNDSMIEKSEFEAYYQRIADAEKMQEIAATNQTIWQYDVGDDKLELGEFADYLQGVYQLKGKNSTSLAQILAEFDVNKDNALDASELYDLDANMPKNMLVDCYPNQWGNTDQYYG